MPTSPRRLLAKSTFTERADVGIGPYTPLSIDLAPQQKKRPGGALFLVFLSSLLPNDPRAAGQAQQRHDTVQGHAHVTGLLGLDGLIRLVSGILDGSGAAGSSGKHCVLLFDLGGSGSVLEILAAAGAIPILDITLLPLGGGLGGEVLQVGMIVGGKPAILPAADLADRLVAAVRRAAGVIGDDLTADIADVIVVLVYVVADDLLAEVADVVVVLVRVVADDLTAEVADMVVVRVHVVADDLLAEVADMIVVRVRVVADPYRRGRRRDRRSRPRGC